MINILFLLFVFWFNSVSPTKLPSSTQNTVTQQEQTQTQDPPPSEEEEEDPSETSL